MNSSQFGWSAARLRRVAVLCTPLLCLGACAPPEPMVASPNLVRDVPAKVRPVKDAPPCEVRITEVTDARSSPEMLGVVRGRAVYAPQDTATWLHSIVEGLQPRGVTPLFGQDGPVSPDDLTAKVSLQIAWMTNTAENITSTAVLHVQAGRAGAPAIDKSYRGSGSRMTVMTGSPPEELQKGIDGAIGKALDSIATDLRQLCKG
jgi:hypothetical protein